MNILHMLMAVVALGGTETNTINIIKNWSNKTDKHFLLSVYCTPLVRTLFTDSGVTIIDIPNISSDMVYGQEMQYAKSFSQAYEEKGIVEQKLWPPFFPSAIKVLTDHAIDVIHAVNWYDVFYGRLLAVVTKTPFVPFLHLDPQKFDCVGDDKNAADALTVAMLGCTYYAVSSATAASFKECVLAKAKKYVRVPELPKVDVISNAIETNYFVFNAESRRTLRKELGIPESAVVIGAAGHLTARKRFGWMVLRVAALKARLKRDDIYVVIAGSGEEQATLLRSSLRAGLRNIKLIGVKSPMAPWYSIFDIFAQTSLAECHSMVVIEAISCGLPCVVTEWAPLHPTITDGVEGFVTSLDDEALFEKRLEQLITDRALRKKMGKKARQTAVERFDVKRVARKYRDVFVHAIKTQAKKKEL